MTFVFASNNSHKLEEIQRLLSEHTILSLSAIGCHDEIEESGETLEANSRIKARYVRQWIRGHYPDLLYDGIFSDDTGLEIDALGGQPGVYTARWAGEPKNDAANRHKALSLLEGAKTRSARFKTVITYITPEGKEEQVYGLVEGSIALAEAGDKGFGYDSIFVPEGYDRTFAELSSETKNSISHRARALMALRTQILKQ